MPRDGYGTKFQERLLITSDWVAFALLPHSIIIHKSRKPSSKSVSKNEKERKGKERK